MVCTVNYTEVIQKALKALDKKNLHIEHVAFPKEIFRNYGSYNEKLEYYGLTVENIKKKLNGLLED